MCEINKLRKCNIQHRDYFIIFYVYLQIFYNNYQWNITFKNCRSLYCRPVTYNIKHRLSSSAAQSFSTLWGPMDCSTPGPPVHHQFREPAQTHVRRLGDAVQPSHPLSSPSPPAFSLSQHQGLFHWVSSSHQVAKVLEFQLQHLFFQWIFRTDFL